MKSSKSVFFKSTYEEYWCRVSVLFGSFCSQKNLYLIDKMLVHKACGYIKLKNWEILAFQEIETF